ncbi:unnamed protein product [Rhizophagus irregularis]|uniref:Uncharacterized protein n=1 Tax=Rhizophagus irregularis TaxID=588596 RepID=A0A915YQ32_9GLOM|nr:unnamed protein product [Rhizophagus irregularis]CAB4484605.1 unnamed protein product [Rhizophagus irregularis]CAB5173135.1 unnamed protein product [Rhizophagus irregularis]CAB5311100.1 unnamed protein product [Rhizophagus irregularis]CAB5324978.1 unnamed protein product [Rhizophagus irregularis]
MRSKYLQFLKERPSRPPLPSGSSAGSANSLECQTTERASRHAIPSFVAKRTALNVGRPQTRHFSPNYLPIKKNFYLPYHTYQEASVRILVYYLEV